MNIKITLTYRKLDHFFLLNYRLAKRVPVPRFQNYLQLIRTMWWFLQSRTILQQIVEFDHASHSFVRQFTYWSKPQINPRIILFYCNIFSNCTSHPAGGSRNTDGAPRCMEARWVWFVHLTPDRKVWVRFLAPIFSKVPKGLAFTPGNF